MGVYNTAQVYLIVTLNATFVNTQIILYIIYTRFSGVFVDNYKIYILLFKIILRLF